jgi:glucose/arabinose dehydrogenase
MCALALAARAEATVVEPQFVEQVFVQSPDLTAATALAWAPDGSNRLFVTRRTGEIRIVKDGQLLATPFATISPIFVDHIEAGIEGLAFDPDFLVDRYLYVFVTVSNSEQQIIRYTVSGDTGIEKTILVTGLPAQGRNHNGGALGFGVDGKLYFAVGDSGSGSGVNNDLTTLASKVGRVNRDGTVPADNPYADGAGPNADPIWARGFRNPFTMTFQPATGLMWLNVVGSKWEQVFVVRRGEHGGWSTYENEQPPSYIAPVITYVTNNSDARALVGAVRASNLVTFTTTTPHHVRPGEPVIVAGVSDPGFNGTVDVASIPSDTTFTARQEGPDGSSAGGTTTSKAIGGCITGGTFYDASDFPAAYRGQFFFGDYNSAQVQRAEIDPDKNSVLRLRQFAATWIEQVDLTVGPDGALYQTGNRDGIIRRVSYQNPQQGLVVSPLHVWMAEGQAALAMVRLAAMPAQPVTVTVANGGGDADVAAAKGAQLTFTAANWNVPQPVTIAAGHDLDTADDVAMLSVAAAGLESQTITVHARDENALQLDTSTPMLKLAEGKSDSFLVSLSARPSLDVVVSVARASGDGDITVSPAALTFSAANWATPQPVMVAAGKDVDVADDTAIISVQAPGLIARTVAVLAADDGVAADAGPPDAPVMADAGAPDAPIDAAVDAALPADTAADRPAISADAVPVAADTALAAGDAGAAPAGSDCGCRLGARTPRKPGAALILLLFLLLRRRFAQTRGSATLRTRRVPPVMNEPFVIESPAIAEVTLRTAMPSDCEDLRTWKNDHRQYFFFQDVISPEMQQKWFAGYQARPDDFMFMVLDRGQAAGCMGFRLRDGQADVYNVILGDSRHGGRGVMAKGMALMCSFARERLHCPVVARVLKVNPAMGWYQKRGFAIEGEEDAHYFIRLAEGFAPVPLVRKEIQE